MYAKRFGLAIFLLLGLMLPATAQFIEPVASIASPNPQAGARFGDTLAAGDVSGDGFVDLIVGAPFADSASERDAGRVYVFLGPDFSGQPQTLQVGMPQASDHFGAVVVTGDVNDDGSDDIAVGAPGRGRVYVFFGGAMFDGMPDISLQSPAAGDSRFGASIAIGDFGNPVEGSGGGEGKQEEPENHTDIAVGASQADVVMMEGEMEMVTARVGQAFVFFGPDFTAESAQALQAATLEVGARFGIAAVAGDLNSDMVDDLVVAGDRTDGSAEGADQPNAGEALGFLGGMMINTMSPVTLRGIDVQGGAAFGRAMAVGDITGDGADDLVVGAPLFDISNSLPDAGVLSVVDGGSMFMGQPAPTATIRGPLASFSYFGSSLALGDVNGDGLNDIVGGAPGLEVAGVANAGGVFILLTSAAPTGTVNTSVALSAPAPEMGASFGDAIVAADVDQNGVADLIVSAPGAEVDGLASAGRIYIFLSKAPTAPFLVDQ